MAPLTDRPRSLDAHLELAGRIRRWREARGWNQQALADRAGFARSTLSKIENGLLSPTFEILLKLAQGFGCDLADLVRAETPTLVGRMVIDRGAVGAGIKNPNARLWPLGAALRGRPFQSMLVEFAQTDLAAFGAWNRHDTDDLLHVLSGTLILHTEGYAPATLNPGDTVHFDGAMPHACLSGSHIPCRCLYVFSLRGAGGEGQ